MIISRKWYFWNFLCQNFIKIYCKSPEIAQFKKYFSWKMPRISLTSRHATRPNSKKSWAPHPPPPHNTTHKNTRHIGLHQQHTVPQHHNYICTPHNVHHTTATQNITPHDNTRQSGDIHIIYIRADFWRQSAIFDAIYVNSIHACLLVTCDIIKSCYTLYISQNYIFQNEEIM